MAEEIRASTSQYTEADASQIAGTRSYMAPEQRQGRTLVSPPLATHH
ncbi:MAG: hypothetical protein FWE67_02370 [Planctomycetaceae bacterium]|nr:hypothetical protein [Planctomycetaceae bacterium]